MFGVCDNDKTIHFVGIGGIGVSGLAEIVHRLGFVVQGSDKAHSSNLDRLEKLGIKVFVGHDASYVDNANFVVYSSAIKSDNVELVRAKSLRIPCLPRAEMLSQIVRLKKSIVAAGSHGKTTVTSLCGSILEMALLCPTIINGGVINAYKTNAKLGEGEWIVVESDESDGSFKQFAPTIGIITNIDREHISHYGSFENLKNSFKIFLENIAFFGSGIVCVDDENVREIINDLPDRRIITYAIERDAMIRAVNIRPSYTSTTFDVAIETSTEKSVLRDVSIPLLGEHNVKNSLAAIGAALELGIDKEIIKSTLATFAGVWRRFTFVGELNGMRIFDDYAHHPTEIKALLSAAKQATSGKIAIVHQPHRYTRLNMLFQDFVDCFDLADVVIITPIYKADETETAKLDSRDLYNELLKKGKTAFFAETPDEVKKIIMDLPNSFDFDENPIILFSGAGNISKWARRMSDLL
ncbi:UDP-N-acetylmuramate--L-alanine ligase [Alphaproteobacteria bacterium]|nr:UDP-N-acetylmuramate--L-alanine ligase [Alphaproteobacteria bacterium]